MRHEANHQPFTWGVVLKYNDEAVVNKVPPSPKEVRSPSVGDQSLYKRTQTTGYFPQEVFETPPPPLPHLLHAIPLIKYRIS